jgi:hypothetical protein
MVKAHSQATSLGTSPKPMNHILWGLKVAKRTYHGNVFVDLGMPNHPNQANILPFEVQGVRDHFFGNVPINLHYIVQHFWPF